LENRGGKVQKIKIFLRVFLSVSAFLSWGNLFLPLQNSAQGAQKDIPFFHSVSPGESLQGIARRYLAFTEVLTIGDLVGKIKDLNGIKGSVIRPNQRLLIPVSRSTPIEARTVIKPANYEARGIYVNRYSMACKKMIRMVDRLNALGGNTVVLDGKDMTGKLSYPSKVELAREIGADANPTVTSPSRLFHYLHKRELHVCVRLVVFCDPLLASARPELALRLPGSGKPWMENGKAAWVNPGDPIVQNYNLDIAKEVAQFGADEIQFDYIRFPTTDNPKRVLPLSEGVEVPRHEIITDFLIKARQALDPYSVLLSIDVFGVIAWGLQEDIQITGQKIDELGRHCDIISPMIYPSHFYGPFRGIHNPADEPFLVVSETSKRFASSLQDSAVTIRPWIQAFPFGTKKFDEEYLIDQLRALNQSNSRGWLLWSAGNSYDVAWKALEGWNREKPQESKNDAGGQSFAP